MNNIAKILFNGFVGVTLFILLPTVNSLLSSMVSTSASSKEIVIPSNIVNIVSKVVLMFTIATTLMLLFTHRHQINNFGSAGQSTNYDYEQEDTDYKEYINSDESLKDDLKENFGIDVEDILKEKDYKKEIRETLSNAESNLDTSNIDGALTHITYSIKIAYLADLIKDSFLDIIDKKIEKIQLLLNLANGTTYDAEKETSINKSIEICKSTINLIRGEIYGAEEPCIN